jgi:hypothetical protein
LSCDRGNYESNFRGRRRQYAVFSYLVETFASRLTFFFCSKKTNRAQEFCGKVLIPFNAVDFLVRVPFFVAFGNSAFQCKSMAYPYSKKYAGSFVLPFSPSFGLL